MKRIASFVFLLFIITSLYAVEPLKFENNSKSEDIPSIWPISGKSKHISMLFGPYTDPDTQEVGFAEEITDAEKQVLATYMKHEWLKRSITNWKNIEMLYHDKDFKISGKAAHLNALINLEAVYDEECKKMANKYSRRVFDYTSLAGDK